MRQRLWENWRRFIEEGDLDERTRADKEGVVLDDALTKLAAYAADSDDRAPTSQIHFTDINKLGINPKSPYDTPLGIYTYPNTNYIRRLFRRGKLPFAQERKYIVVAKVREGKNIIFHLGDDETISQSEYEEMLDKLGSDALAAANPQLGSLASLNSEMNAIKHGTAFDLNREAKNEVYGKLEAASPTAERWLTTKEGRPNDDGLSRAIADRIIGDYLTYPFKETRTVDQIEKDLRAYDDYWDINNVGDAMITEEDRKVMMELLTVLDDRIEEAVGLTQKGNLKANKGESDAYLMQKYSKIFQEAKKGSNFQHRFGYIWNLTRLLSQGDTSKSQAKGKAMIAWRRLLVQLGIDGVVDAAGEGLIHPSEKVQGVFFSKAILEKLEVIPNTQTPDAINRREGAKEKLAQEKRTMEMWKDLTGLAKLPRGSKLNRALLAKTAMDALYTKVYKAEDEDGQSTEQAFDYDFRLLMRLWAEGYKAKQHLKDRLADFESPPEQLKMRLTLLKDADAVVETALAIEYYNYIFASNDGPLGQIKRKIKELEELDFLTQEEKYGFYNELAGDIIIAVQSAEQGKIPAREMLRIIHKESDRILADLAELEAVAKSAKSKEP